MGSICANRDTPKSFLNFAIWFKQITLRLNDFENSIVIARNTTKINRNNCFGVLINGSLNSIVIHFETIRLAIDKHEFGTDVAHNRGACRVSISRNNYFVARSHIKKTKRHFCTCSL